MDLVRPLPICDSLEDQIKKLTFTIKQQNKKIHQQSQDNLVLRDDAIKLKKEKENLYIYNPAIFLTINRDFVIKNLNFRAAMLLNFDRSNLINALFLKFISTDSHVFLRNTIQSLFEKRYKQLCEIAILHTGGHKKYVALEATLIDNELIHLCLTDTTHHRNLLKELHEVETSYKLMEDIFQQTDEALATFDAGSNIKLVNPTFIKTFADICYINIQIGTNLIDSLSDFPELKSQIIKACDDLVHEKNSTVIVENHCNNNEAYYYYEMYFKFYYNQRTRKNEFLLRIKNLRNHKLNEKRQYKQLADISVACTTSTQVMMASALAHEINQPLTAITTYSQASLFLIEKDPNIDGTYTRLIHPLQQIAAQAELAGNIVHNMLGLMRETGFDREEMEINTVITDALSILRHKLIDFKCHITLDLSNEIPNIYASKTHIMQIVLNLIRNSLDALKSAAEVKPELHLSTKNSDGFIVTTINDNGPGVPIELQHKILHTFFTTKNRGTGIGLAICQTILEAHGGELSFLQKKTKGASLQFTLPINMNQHANT